MPTLLSQTYSQKQTYLIDCHGYHEDDFDTLGELALDDIIISEGHLNDFNCFTESYPTPPAFYTETL